MIVVVALQESGSENLTGQSAAVRLGGDAEAGLRDTAGHAEEKAIRLLSQKNFDAERFRRNVNSLHLKASYEPLQPLGETDIAGYLEHHHDMIVVTAVRRPVLYWLWHCCCWLLLCVCFGRFRYRSYYIFGQGVQKNGCIYTYYLCSCCSC